MSEIYHVRLNTGEDIISEILWPEKKLGHEDHIVLLNPMKIICIPSSKPGYISLSLMQWVFSKITSDQKFNIYNRDILTMSHPNSSLKEYYKETVDFFSKKSTTEAIYEDDTTAEEFFDQIQDEIDAVNMADKLFESKDTDELKNIVSEFLNSLTANNRGTLH